MLHVCLINKVPQEISNVQARVEFLYRMENLDSDSYSKIEVEKLET